MYIYIIIRRNVSRTGVQILRTLQQLVGVFAMRLGMRASRIMRCYPWLRYVRVQAVKPNKVYHMVLNVCLWYFGACRLRLSYVCTPVAPDETYST